MIAKAIRGARGLRNAEGTADCALHLPQLDCPDCGESWCETEVWYPSLSIAKSADPNKFNEDLTVGIKELTALRKQLVGVGARKLRLVPCAGIGPVKGKVPPHATDFVWCGFRLLARRRVVDKMESHSVILPHGPAKVSIGRELSDDYLALELDSIPLWDDQTLRETTVVYCRSCKGYSMQNIRADLNQPKRYVKSRMPRGQGLVRVNESYVTLATEEFIEVYNHNKMTGLEFKEEGSYV